MLRQAAEVSGPPLGSVRAEDESPPKAVVHYLRHPGPHGLGERIPHGSPPGFNPA